ncbi:hypothetical protein N7474_005529 [Penicillium riverlandense]|uniref:uncharacterized protein n=1 Tax=Penicillium riverlandense TaxID=1903569 RepID=UPI002548E5EF|nr:uncharacterized protein N7474_005529 [Penicillium riverlandense]KAJ5819938.1 hypothetical protein N7474_005529 [Penicillium riverlandense]
MPSIRTVLYTTFVILTLPLRILGTCLYYLPRVTRPNTSWTYHEVLGNTLFRFWFKYATAVKFHTAKSLEPGREKERFIVIDPPTEKGSTSSSSPYRGIVLNDPKIQPSRIGAVWYSSLYSSLPDSDKPLERMVLHFHPGAYVLGGARELEGGYGPHVLSKAMGCPDAITSYVYAVKALKVPHSQIVMSGSSAGGNLVLALLRYLATDNHQALDSLPVPRAALLWSPWLDLRIESVAALDTHRNINSDYLFTALGNLGI